MKANPLILQLPLGSEDTFEGVIDLLEMKAIIWDDDSLGATFRQEEIPETEKERADTYREKLIESLADVDDQIMEAYLGEGGLTLDILKTAIRKAVLELKLVPVLCGSALKNKGIQPLLDAVVDYLPSPKDVPPIQGIHPETGETIVCPSAENKPLAALIFKVAMMEGRKLSYVRVYSGRLEAGKEVYNPIRKTKEKVSRLLRMHANKRERIDMAGAGNIVGVVGLKDSSTGETLCPVDHPVILENIEVYEPVISIAVEPKTHSDQDKLEEVLAKFVSEDPTLRVRQDEDTGQMILSGMGELHLEVIISRMRREFNTQVNVGKPQVVYRESIQKTAEATAVFDRMWPDSGITEKCGCDFSRWNAEQATVSPTKPPRTRSRRCTGPLLKKVLWKLLRAGRLWGILWSMWKRSCWAVFIKKTRPLNWHSKSARPWHARRHWPAARDFCSIPS